MKTFTFQGDWMVNLELPQLAKFLSDSSYVYSYNKELVNVLSNGFVPCLIGDECDYNPDPLSEQIATINYLLNNEIEVLKGLLHAMNNIIYPAELEKTDYREDWFPKLNSIHDLSKALYLTRIGIDTIHKDCVSYMRFDFNYSGDNEHGIAMYLHKDRVIDFAGCSGLSNDKVVEDSGVKYNEYFQKMIAKWEARDIKLHKPLPKYNKLKPWQIKATELFLKRQNRV